MTDTDQQMEEEDVTVRLMRIILGMTEEQRMALLSQLQAIQSSPSKSGERESIRKPYVNSIEFFIKGRACMGVSQNISSNGIFIKTDEPVSIGQTIILSIPFTNNQKTIRVPAHVVRTTHKGIGVEFLRGNEEP
ncbi:MAG: PilZ domain-containing protein [Thermodesulfobacteriota bacterium]